MPKITAAAARPARRGSLPISRVVSLEISPRKMEIYSNLSRNFPVSPEAINLQDVV